MDTNPHRLLHIVLLYSVVFSSPLIRRYNTSNTWGLLLQIGWLYIPGDCLQGEGHEMARYDYSPEWEDELEGNIDFDLYDGMNDEMQRIVDMVGDNATLAHDLISQAIQNKKDQGLIHNSTYSHGIFRESMLAYQAPRKISVDEVRKYAEPMVAHIWNNFYELQHLVERYEAHIQERWEAKSEEERRDVLNRAWGLSPPMAPEHRPDLTHFKHQCTGLVCNESNNTNVSKRPHFLWPNINLEDLCKTEPLIFLLNARGRNPPSTFAFAELEPLVFGIRSGSLRVPPFLDGWNMRFLGKDSPGSYGELVSWEDDPDAHHRLLRCRDVSPGEGLWILEIQDRLYKFLLETCKAILHDFELQDKQGRPEPKPPISIDKYKGDIATSRLFSRYKSIYHVPEEFDIKRLQSIVSAKLSQAEDTLWALREDPGFFAHSLLELYSHRPEHMLDVNGNVYPSVATEHGREEVLISTVRSMLSYYVPIVETWGSVYELVNRLASLKEGLFDRVRADERPEDDLPLDLEVAFRSLRHHLDHFLDEHLPAVNRWARWSPPIQPLYRPNVPETPDAKMTVTTGNTPPNPLEAVYLWVLYMMADPHNLKNIGINSCIQEIERIAHEPEGRKFFTSFVAEQFSGIFVMAECVRQIGLFQPWAAAFETRIEDKKARKQISEEFKRTAEVLGPLCKLELPGNAGKLGAELTRMKYPVDEPLNKTNVEAMQAAEKTLDIFWDEVIGQLRKAGLWNGRVRNVLGKTPKRTGSWGGSSNTTPSGNTVGNIPKRIQQVLGSPADDIGGHTPLNTQEQEQKNEPPPYKPDERARKTFAALFHEPSAAGPGSPKIPWKDFLYAMHRVGFEIEELGGSNWHFSPGHLLPDQGHEHARAIQFHEPGPGADITSLVARMYSRRLAGTYGWRAERFAEASGGEL
ncbi:uncharacterized protein F4812DRAFT_443319 [Daldinia caldariorum]|uniref:uncharacterized protein n=1 Tax=Daldinia caldariorum TaxID=326644 RepID=UPI00200783E0|nr:uncharacterized protein F4812DRAFT_443319 [Daldinia caldariorum]KAI1464406.1 hypothetical protein F4812DRAFT_443319 [Daldinia caldariorum]